MERTVISWNIANWVTVILMALAGYALLLAISKVIAPPSPMVAG